MFIFCINAIFYKTLFFSLEIDNMWKVYLEKHPNDTGRFKTIEQFMEVTFIEEFSTPLENLQYSQQLMTEVTSL